MKKRSIFTTAGILMILAAILSCGPPGGMLQEEEPAVEIDTVRTGGFVSPSDTIPLSVIFDSENVFPDRMEIYLKSAEGEVLAVEEVDAFDLAEQVLPPLSLPDLETGLYVLEFFLYEGEDLIQEKQTEFFYVAGDYNIQGISSYPPIISPGSTAVFQARLDVPPESDPFLVWKIGEKVLASGYVSEGRESLQWTAPEVEGVYSIRLDLYPVGPTTNKEFTFASEHSLSTEVFVTSVSSEGKNELGPGDSYFTLFHFRGNTDDDSELGGSRRVGTIGVPEMALRGSLFGYYLDGSSGFSVSGSLLPVLSGAPAPFSVEFRLLLDGPEMEGNVFTVSSESMDSRFRIFLDGSGRPVLEVNQGIQSLRVEGSSGELEPGRVYLGTLSVQPVEKGQLVTWFLNGEKISADIVPISLPRFGDDAVSIIGGEDGFSGVIDEFGVYYMDGQDRFTPDPDVYREAMMYQLGGDLIFAEGFDGMYLPESLSYSGDIRNTMGTLRLGPQSFFRMPEIEISQELLIVEMDFPELSRETVLEAVQITASGEIKPLFRYYPETGTAARPGGEVLVSEMPDMDGLYGFILEHGATGLLLVNGKDKIPLAGAASDPVRLSFSLINGSEETSLELETILIRREQTRIVKEQKAEPEQVEPEPENV